MRFTSLTLENFKSFEQTCVRFSPGFNVLKGPNEAGKSTIQAALLVVLFADPKASTESLEQVVRWGQDRRPHVKLEFDAEGTSYSLDKDFEAGTVSLTWSAHADGLGGSTSENEEVHRLIGTVLGLQSLETYLNTACIRSEEVSKLPSTAAPISQRLQAKVTSGRHADAGEALASIDRELATLSSSGLRKVLDGGPLHASHERVESLQRSCRNLAEKLATVQANISVLFRLRQEVMTVEHEISDWSHTLERSDVAQTLEEDVALLEEHETDLRNMQVLRENVGHAAAELSNVDYDTVAEALVRAQALERTLHHQSLRESAINHELAIHVLTQIQNVPAVAPDMLIVGGAACSVGLTFAALALHMPVLLAAVLVGIGMIALGLRGRGARRADDTSPFTDELAICVKNIEQTQLDLHRLLATYKLHSVEELATAVRAMHPSTDAQSMRRQHIENLLGEYRTTDHQAALARVTAEIATRREALSELAASRLSGSAYEHADTMLQTLNAKRESLQRELYRLEGELGASTVNSESLAVLEEELAVEQLRLVRLERRRKGLELARSGLREAVAATLAQVSGAFRIGISRHLNSITGGRYDQVDAEIGENGLHLMVYTSERHRAVRADSLSRATQDQIYLAARMSLLDLVCDGRHPPLLLDDPFVNYDEGRMANTVALMRDIYAGYQIILFTCVDRYDHFADNLYSLAGPDRMPAEPEAAAS